MPIPTDRRTAEPVLGLVLVGLLGLVGVAAVLMAAAQVASYVVRDLYLVVALGVLALYVGTVFLPALRRQRERDELGERLETVERALKHTFRQLQFGDLVEAARHAGDLPAHVASAFETATHALGSLVQQIQNSSIEVAGAGNSVHDTANELASGSSEQAAATVEITATMEELARTAAQIASNAASQAELSVQAEASGDSGAAAVEEALRGVEEVQKRITAIASRADSLDSRSKEIYRVLDLITEIAQETHILALNAAIEAAATGEHGRRFAVVADEVRRLAQRSRESVDSVRHLLDEFAASIRATVIATEEGGKDALTVLDRARDAAGTIEELRGALSDTARAAREISMATEQQRTASDQVVLTLKEVSQVIQRMAEGLKHFTGTADRLNQLALSIQLLTQSFRLDSPRSLKQIAETWAQDIGYQAGHWEALEGRLAEFLREHAFVELAYVVDGRGLMVSAVAGQDHDSSSPLAAGTSFGERPWFQAVIRDEHTIITPLYDSLLSGERCFTVATPVHGPDGQLLGVAGLDVNARSWTRI